MSSMLKVVIDAQMMALICRLMIELINPHLDGVSDAEQLEGEEFETFTRVRDFCQERLDEITAAMKAKDSGNRLN